MLFKIEYKDQEADYFTVPTSTSNPEEAKLWGLPVESDSDDESVLKQRDVRAIKKALEMAKQRSKDSSMEFLPANQRKGGGDGSFILAKGHKAELWATPRKKKTATILTVLARFLSR